MKHESTFANYRELLDILKSGGYTFRTHADFVNNGAPNHEKTLLLRHDVDFDRELRKTLRLVEQEDAAGVASTVFVRLHDPYYNALGFRELHTMYRMLDAGCELGLHCETEDLASALGEGFDPADLLKRDIQIFETALNIKTAGVAPHGDLTAYNNQNILDRIDLSSLGLKYHAYQQKVGLFRGWYISNYGGNDWKRYVDGNLAESGQHDFIRYAHMAIEQQAPLVTFLVHPGRWYDIHYLVE